jgi:hypothetical protein
MSIKKICKRYDIENYTINPDGTIDVYGDVNLSFYDLTELPLTFNKITGCFDCDYNQLTTLKGSPKCVGDSFYCSHNRLTSLEFGPDYVDELFYCIYNDLTDNYSDTEIGGSFYTTLKQEGLIFDGNIATNYKEWRKLYKRKLILDDIFNM